MNPNIVGSLSGRQHSKRSMVRACVDFTCEGGFLVEHQAFVATRGVLNEPYLGK